MTNNVNHIWYHFVWTTRYRQPMIKPVWKNDLLQQIISRAAEEGILVTAANAMVDHVHLLVRVPPVLSPAKVANILKGESSNWLNQMGMTSQIFHWQSGFSVFSISYTHLTRVRRFILDQQRRHDFTDLATELRYLREMAHPC